MRPSELEKEMQKKTDKEKAWAYSKSVQNYLDSREENIELRRLLWENHGHNGLYGDDGEMQCGACGVDFKRDSIKTIEKAIRSSK